MTRQSASFKLRLDKRMVEITAYDSVGVEDCFDVLTRAALHRIMTKEDWTEPIPREIKDFIIKTSLFI